MSELKRCPFCGGEAKLKQYYPHMTRRVKTRIYCSNCRANSGDWGLKNKAIEAWNTRKPMQNIVERLEHFNEETFYRANGRANGKTLAYGYSQGIYKAIEIVKEEGGAE